MWGVIGRVHFINIVGNVYISRQAEISVRSWLSHITRSCCLALLVPAHDMQIYRAQSCCGKEDNTIHHVTCCCKLGLRSRVHSCSLLRLRVPSQFSRALIGCSRCALLRGGICWEGIGEAGEGLRDPGGEVVTMMVTVTVTGIEIFIFVPLMLKRKKYTK